MWQVDVIADPDNGPAEAVLMAQTSPLHARSRSMAGKRRVPGTSSGDNGVLTGDWAGDSSRPKHPDERVTH